METLIFRLSPDRRRPLKNIAYFDLRHFSDNKKTLVTGFSPSVISVFLFVAVFYCRLYESIFDLYKFILHNARVDCTSYINFSILFKLTAKIAIAPCICIFVMP